MRNSYKFRGYTITNQCYHQPDHCVWWEAVDSDGNACFHGHTLREVEFMIIDYEWEEKFNKKCEELDKTLTKLNNIKNVIEKAVVDIEIIKRIIGHEF